LIGRLAGRAPEQGDLAHARRLLERWRLDYNQVRPHSSIATSRPPGAAARRAPGPLSAQQ
jgi:transposase InsO family protein